MHTGVEMPTAKKKAVRKKAVRKGRFDPTKFKPAPGSVPAQMAEMLNWAAEVAPGQVVTYPQITRVVMGLSRTPRHDSKDVEAISRRTTPTRKKLQALYGRDLVTEPGLGCRATVDDIDVTTHCVPARMKRVHTAVEALNATIGVIKELTAGQMPKELEDLGKWYFDDVQKFVKDVSKHKNKMLAPKVEDE